MKKSGHPLAGIVLDLAKNHRIVDVTDVAMAFSGNAIFRGKDSRKGRDAYRVVAADVLGVMAREGILEKHGARPISADGGVWFRLTSEEPTATITDATDAPE